MIIKQTFFLIICLLLLSSCFYKHVDNFYLPKNFTGHVAIIYKKGGQKLDRTQDYKIPTDGILWTNFERWSGNFEVNYFRENENGKYDKLFYRDFSKDSLREEVYFLRLISFSKTGQVNPYEIVTFYFGKKDQGQMFGVMSAD
ncbi:MAG: hypothetical protein MUF43_14820 [Flavobacterium sp.]|nr:hypothetical protein [Flavobacterium sp.]